MRDLLLEYLKHIMIHIENFMYYEQKQISLRSMDNNNKLNIKLKQVPSSDHENHNSVLNNSKLLSLWNFISIS